MHEIGAKKTADLARRMGVNQSKLDEVPSLALGTSPVTPLEMVAAYSTLAAGGEYRQPTFVSRITDKSGNTLAEFSTEAMRVMSDKTVEDLINILRDAVDQGTGKEVRARFGLRADVAGKTGTTQRNTDGWFILMHPRLVAGAWVGFNDSRITMRSNYWGEGAHNALLLVGDFFRQTFAARLIDGGARFPYSRPDDSIWEPYFDTAKEWLFNAVREWLVGESAKTAPLPRRTPRRQLEGVSRHRSDDMPERREPRDVERQREKQRLFERLRQKREQWEQERLERNW
jgi:penicillin-binding protein 1A